MEEGYARSVLPLGTGNTDLGRRNPGSPNIEVVALKYSGCHSTFHVPAGTLIWLLPLQCETAGERFKCRLRLDPEKTVY